jgi:hypothetical protein
MSNDKPGFDPSLLTRPAPERLQHFRSYVAKHKRLTDLDKQITAALDEPAGAGFMFVVGPTGIGKSTVRDVIFRRVMNQAMADMQTDPGYIPIAGIEVIASGHKSYNWHDHWTRALDALEEPLIKHKTLPARSKIDRLTSGARLRERTAALRRSFEIGARERRLKAFTLDEAQHLTHVPATLLRYQLETVKSVANLSKALHVLFGTYELLLLRNASGQLGRRAVTVHFDRYQANSDQDILAFAEVVQTFQLQMPLPERPDLLPHLEYCFERSLGCVGVLKDWFSRALSEAINKKAKTLTVTDLRRHELPPSVLLAMSAEFVDGEKRLFEEDAAFALIKERLGIRARQRKQAKRAGTPENGKAKKSKRGFGRRSPKRDKVGAGRNASTQLGDTES